MLFWYRSGAKKINQGELARLKVVSSQKLVEAHSFFGNCGNSEAHKKPGGLVLRSAAPRDWVGRSSVLGILSFGLRALHGRSSLYATCTNLQSAPFRALLSRLLLTRGSRPQNKAPILVCLTRFAGPSLFVRRASDRQFKIESIRSDAGTLSWPAGVFWSGSRWTLYRCPRQRNYPFPETRCI